QRVAQIHAAASDPDVNIVLALRGSYGLSRLLPAIDFELLAQSGKLFVGYSDFTLVHQGLLQRGRCSLAGPMLCDDYTREQQSVYTLDQFIHCISSDRHRVEFDTAYSGDLQVSG
ncbi:LD-carboxypeptidase, partial [Undibacterium luofuense]